MSIKETAADEYAAQPGHRYGAVVTDAFKAGWEAAVQVGIEAARASGRFMPSAWLALEAQGATEEDLFGTERLDVDRG